MVVMLKLLGIKHVCLLHTPLSQLAVEHLKYAAHGFVLSLCDLAQSVQFSSTSGLQETAQAKCL